MFGKNSILRFYPIYGRLFLNLRSFIDHVYMYYLLLQLLFPVYYIKAASQFLEYFFVTMEKFLIMKN